MLCENVKYIVNIVRILWSTKHLAFMLVGQCHNLVIIILGDARNNYGEAKDEILRELYNKAKRVIWLNPEPKMSWTVGDAEMKKYAPCCHQTEVCNSLVHLERVVSNLLRTAT